MQYYKRNLVLAQIARTGFLLVTHTPGRKGGESIYSYANGTAAPINSRDFAELRREHFILPIEHESLLDDPLLAQRFRARTPADGRP
jgi:hypothetical protein